MKLIPILVSILFSVSAAADTTATAKAFVERSLKDPSSVQYRNVTAYPDGVTCGEYNARNGYGGYAGFSWFVFSLEQYHFLSTEATPRDVRVLCTNPSRLKFALHALIPTTRELVILAEKCRDQIHRPGGQDYCKAGHDLVAQYKADYPGTLNPKFEP